MTLNELVDEVYILTNRPDLVNETSQAVRRATLKLHSIDTFPRDLTEVGLLADPAGYFMQFDISYLEGCRAIAYIRDDTGLTPTTNNKFFTFTEPRAVLDDYGQVVTDIWYQGGASIHIKSSTSITGVQIGYYRVPDVSNSSYSSWIAELAPYAIIDEASAMIFKLLGKDVETRNQEQQAAISRRELLVTYLEGVAR